MDIIKSPYIIQLVLRGLAPIFRLMPKTILNLRMYRKSGQWIDWSNPRNLQEFALTSYFKAATNEAKFKTYVDLADKVCVRDFVMKRTGDETLLTKLYGVWKRPEDIDFDKLPMPCVIKTNNGCTTNIIVRTREELKPMEIRCKLSQWLKYPYGELSGQPHYSRIKPMIFAEEFLEQNPGTDDLPYDYKFFCYDGEPHFILFYSGRTMNSHVTQDHVYDTSWQLVPGVVRNPKCGIMPKPAQFEKMIDVARKLSKGYDFVRVDLYSIGDRVVFGEMTFTPDMVTNFTSEFLKNYYEEHIKK